MPTMWANADALRGSEVSVILDLRLVLAARAASAGAVKTEHLLVGSFSPAPVEASAGRRVLVWLRLRL